MLTIYGVTKGHLEERQHIAPRSLVRLTNPEDWEIDYVRKTCGGIDGNDLRAAMDDEEPSRFEENGAYTLLVVDVPVPELHGKTQAYRTYPLAIITTAKSSVITTSRIDFAALDSSGIDPRKVTIIDGKTRFVYDLLMHMATAYQRYLRDIESRRARLVEGLDHTSRRFLATAPSSNVPRAVRASLRTRPMRRSSTTSLSKSAKRTKWHAPTASSSRARANSSRASWTTG